MNNMIGTDEYKTNILKKENILVYTASIPNRIKFNH